MGVNQRKRYAKRSYLASSPLVKKGFKSITEDCVKTIRILEEEGPLRHGELMEMTGIPKGTLDRRLYHLRAIEAIYLIKRKYVAASRRVEEEIEMSEDVKIASSHKRIPELRQHARILVPSYSMKEVEYVDEQDKIIRFNRTRADLRHYPNVSKLIDKRAKIEGKVDLIREGLRRDLMEKLKKKFKNDSVIEPEEEKNNQSFLRTVFPAQIRSYLLSGNPIQIMVEGEKIWFGDTWIAKGPHLESRIREFVNHEIKDPHNIETKKRTQNLQESANMIGQEIEREIREIIEDIKSGIPLRRKYTRYRTK